MGIFRFFKKREGKPPVLLRCTNCRHECNINHDKIVILQLPRSPKSICTIMEECSICHIGFMLAVDYTDDDGKRYEYRKMRPKIKKLDHKIFTEPADGSSDDTIEDPDDLYDDSDDTDCYFFNDY